MNDFDVLWRQVRADFAPDGALRDIYVRNAAPPVWEVALSFIRRVGYDLAYTVDGEPRPVPRSAIEALRVRPEASPLLRFRVGRAELACHFFDARELELDFDPRAIDHATALAPLVAFLGGLARATGLDTVVTYENMPEAVILTVEGASGEVRAAVAP